MYVNNCNVPELLNSRQVVTIEGCPPPKYEVPCYVCEQCNDKFDFLCDFRYHLINHSESGRQYVEIFLCGEFPRAEVKEEIKNLDFVIKVEYPSDKCETNCYIPCHLCGAEYEVVYVYSDKTSNYPYYVGCRPEIFTNLERRTKCFLKFCLAFHQSFS